MKKMKIEKQLIFADHVHKVVSLHVVESLTYKHEEDGIRAMGPLSIKGQYEGDEGIEEFTEVLEMDVLAPQEKLSGEEFLLKIADYQGVISEDGITIHVTLEIHGLKDAKTQAEPQTVEAASVQEIEHKEVSTIKEYSKPVPVMKKEDSKTETKHQPIASMEEDGELELLQMDNDFEDIFPDAESTYTSYRIIVAKPNDTYTGIAQRYEVDESALRDTNKNKEILPKTLVILPFQ